MPRPLLLFFLLCSPRFLLASPAACLSPGATRTFRLPAASRTALHCVSPLAPGACYEVRVSLPAWAPLGVSITLLDGGARNASHAEGEEKLAFCAGRPGGGPAAVALAFPRRGPAPLTAAADTPYDVRVDELYGGVLPAVALRLALPLALAGAATLLAAAAAARSGGRTGGRARQRRAAD